MQIIQLIDRKENEISHFVGEKTSKNSRRSRKGNWSITFWITPLEPKGSLHIDAFLSYFTHIMDFTKQIKNPQINYGYRLKPNINYNQRSNKNISLSHKAEEVKVNG